MWSNVKMEPTPGTEAWYAQVTEDILEPERPIVDPHHHLWSGWDIPDYLLEDLWNDTGSGHKIVKTVFIELRSRRWWQPSLRMRNMYCSMARQQRYIGSE
jgi:hypothetical protein